MKKSLIDSNPYLQNSKEYRASLLVSVASSTAIETGASVESVSQQITKFASKYFKQKKQNLL